MSAERTSLGISGRIAAAFQASRMTPLLALVALLMGIFATLVTPREEEPQIDVTMADVLVAFPGASAKDVENLVARPGEQVLSRMHGVEHVYSMSRPGMAVITVQFEVGVKYNDAVLRLYDTVHSHRDWLAPNLGVMEPVIKPARHRRCAHPRPDFLDGRPGAFGLRPAAGGRAVEIELKRIKGTRDVSTLGGPDHAIRVLMDAEADERLRRHAAGHRRRAEVSNALQSCGNLTRRQPRGAGADRYLPRTAADVKRLVVAVATKKSRKADLPEPMWPRCWTGPTNPSATPGSGWARRGRGRRRPAASHPGGHPDDLQEAGRERGRRGQRCHRPHRGAEEYGDPGGRRGDGDPQLRRNRQPRRPTS